MILIQDGSQPPNIDKPLRIIGDPYKVQVLLHSCRTVEIILAYAYLPLKISCVFCADIFFSKQRRWLMRFYEKGIMQALETETNMDQGWEEKEVVVAAAAVAASMQVVLLKS